MIKYSENKWAIIFLILVLIIEVLAIIVLVQKKDLIRLLLLIPGFLISLPIFIAVSQQEVLIDDNAITLKLGLPFLFKPKTMLWENIDVVTKDSVLGITVCRLISRSSIKPRVINISGIKNTNSMIIEIVKKAKFASIDPALRKLAEKNKGEL